MAEHSRAATWDDVVRIARWLEEAGAEYALVGGYALFAHGLTRLTEDVDILVEPSAANSRRWIAALARLPDGAARELETDPDVFAAGGLYAVRINDEITIDVLPAAGGKRWQELKAHVVTVEIDGKAVRVLDLVGLLETKRGLRDKDRIDAGWIEHALEELKRR